MNNFVGIDIGASTTKAIIIDEKKEILGYSVINSGADFKAAAEEAFKKSRENAKGKTSNEYSVLATGYGRRNVSFADQTRTEISCHAQGSFFYFPHSHTLIDIGGQDSKIIKVNDSGKRIGFKMNRKCAAGTGAFLEEIANRLRVKIESSMNLQEKRKRTLR